MSIIRHTIDGRRAAEKIMTTTVSIGTIVDGFDPETGEATQEVLPIWSGKGRIHTGTVNGTLQDGAGAVFTTTQLVLSVPVAGTSDIAPDMAVEVTANPLDASLVGQMYTIRSASGESQQVARRFEIERIN